MTKGKERAIACERFASLHDVESVYEGCNVVGKRHARLGSPHAPPHVYTWNCLRFFLGVVGVH